MVNVEELRAYAAGLLKEGKVKAVIGYRQGTAGVLPEPCVITDAAEAGSLVWTPASLHNLSLYLVKDRKAQALSKTPDNRPLGIVAKGCDSRAVAVLLQENFFKREDVVVIGVSCENTGVIDPRKLSAKLKGKVPNKVEFKDNDSYAVTLGGKETVIPAHELMADRCLECREAFPAVHDVMYGEAVKERSYEQPFTAVKEAEKASPDERWAQWEHHFDRCLRCYACRSVCPMCYCPECIVDTINVVVTPDMSAEDKANRIRWCERSSNTAESATYHLTRAIHLAGRCVDCGECERVCPVDIPIRLLNTKLEMESFEMFQYEAGRDITTASLLSSFKDDDPNSFIR